MPKWYVGRYRNAETGPGLVNSKSPVWVIPGEDFLQAEVFSNWLYATLAYRCNGRLRRVRFGPQGKDYRRDSVYIFVR
ncbi:hypothetical protein [Lewinella sp. IMCC34183]|uniref:hypothetical protein n=1 Tax=Lewinella sp. IMCC34183 TaxID=2248762 RepID=UPI000E27D704|nr:hypothetical protein [Lewinella sp. IMCC34183]